MYHSPFPHFSIPDGKRSFATFDKGALIHASRVCALRGFACLAAVNRGNDNSPTGVPPYPLVNFAFR